MIDWEQVTTGGYPALLRQAQAEESRERRVRCCQWRRIGELERRVAELERKLSQREAGNGTGGNITYTRAGEDELRFDPVMDDDGPDPFEDVGADDGRAGGGGGVPGGDGAGGGVALGAGMAERETVRIS